MILRRATHGNYDADLGTAGNQGAIKEIARSKRWQQLRRCQLQWNDIVNGGTYAEDFTLTACRR